MRITRAHLEEDVGKSFHFERNSGVDFNRAGVPLMEIVSEPDITSADMAYEYLNALKDILVYGGVSDCDMEKGMVRCDVNVSVRPKGTKELGAKIEIKNMNSFSGVRRALEYEIPRQIEVLKKGGKLIQSTRRWDDAAGVTEEMRTKEHAHDYRYFPDPDLMPFEPTEKWLAEVKSRVVELPLARKQRFMRDYGLPASDAQTFVWDVPLGNYFERIAKQSKNPKAVANWVINNLRAKLAEANERSGSRRPALSSRRRRRDASRYRNDAGRSEIQARSHCSNSSGWSKPRPSAARPHNRCLPKCSTPANRRQRLFRKKVWRRSATPARLKNSATRRLRQIPARRPISNPARPPR